VLDDPAVVFGRLRADFSIRLDIDWLRRKRLILPGARVLAKLTFNFYDNEIEIQCESIVGAGWDSCIRLRYEIHDWRGELHRIDDTIFLTATQPMLGGLRWWFLCPHSNRRVRKLHLPLGGRHFWSRRAYRLRYASQREPEYDRAIRRARKLRLRLGGDPDGDQYPEKPKRMRWATYNGIMEKLEAEQW
jgi:hypothetical protein